MVKPAISLAWIPLVLLTLSQPAFADEPPGAKKVPEFTEMLGSILVHGSNMSPYSGWFHPAQSLYGWDWLAGRFDRNNDGFLSADELEGSGRLFRALDRDHNEAITPEDLDWSPSSPYLRSRAQARRHFSMMDRNGNGRISPEEWARAFEQASKGKDFLTQDDLADLLYPAQAAPVVAKKEEKAPEPQGPSRLTLLKGLFSGEIGSITEGPGLGEEAPDFTLETHDKSKRISLSDYRGKKPVVLIFGSFT